ncbi:MAG: type VI secretion system-associated protein TagF [Proteobacteria bacterium]|nr:type VI secretion system-associated protein TagF [Pseudomonadota bacterium]
MLGAAPLAGLYGKLPARGDFVCQRLPRAFTEPWDDWVAAVLSASRAALGAAWLPAWLEAPVWRFALAAGVCGPRPALGLMLPSVDRAGRYFPLAFAALFTAPAGPDEGDDSGAEGDAAWLGRCEAAGRAALDEDADPDAVLALMGAPPSPPAPRPAGSRWWTEGGPRVPPGHIACPGLPDAATFIGMIAGTSARDAPAP